MKLQRASLAIPANISQTSKRKIDEHEYLRIGFNNPNINGFPPWGSNESLALSLMSIYRSAVASSHTDLSYFSNWRFIADFFSSEAIIVLSFFFVDIYIGFENDEKKMIFLFPIMLITVHHSYVINKILR